MPRINKYVLGLIGTTGLFVFDVIPFRSLGFYCGDPKISYKFRGDTISLGWLLGASFFIPLVGVGLVECLNLETETSTYYSEKKKEFSGVKLAWHWYRQFLVGLCLVIFATEAAKSIVSEPRPHFLDTCRPDKAINCSAGYVYNFRCNNPRLSSFYVKDSYRSFPSGHTSIAVYATIFIMWYFQRRISDSKYLLVPWLHCVCTFLCLLCALTRITDRRHHWWDVLAGSVFGVIIAIFTVQTRCKGFYIDNIKLLNQSEKNEQINGGVRHNSGRRLLSSTSSYSTPPDDRELREVQTP